MCSVLDPPRFTMEHKFNRHGKWDPNEDFMDPFEYYSFHAVAFAIDPTTNSSVHVSVFGVLDTLGDFVIHSHDTADTSAFTYKSGDGLVSMEVQSRVLRAEIKRSVISKAFAICVFLGNWAMTIGSVYATVLVAFDRLEANSVITALPFSALLAIPAIRSLYSSSLGVSIGEPITPPICSAAQPTLPDAVAFFVQTATIGLCCLVLLRVLTRCRSSCTTGYPV